MDSLRERYENANPSIKEKREAARKRGVPEEDVQKIGLSDEKIIENIHNNQLLNEQSGLFKNKTDVEVVPAKPKEVEWELDGVQSKKKHGSQVQEVNIDHKKLPKNLADELESVAKKRADLQAQKKRIEKMYEKYASNHPDPATRKWQRVEDTPAWKKAHKEMIEQSEKLGELSSDAVFIEKMGGKQLDAELPGGGKSGQFDRVYEVDGKIYVVEAKGAGSSRGTRMIGEKAFEQGTKEYFDDIVKNMTDKLKNLPATDPKRIALKNTLDKINLARSQGKFEYLQATQKVSTSGSLVNTVDFINFGIK